jgi:hypothetical protein
MEARIRGWARRAFSLQRPSQHQPKNSDNHSEVQKQIAGCDDIPRNYKLQNQVNQDERKPNDGQQPFAVGKIVGHEI